MVGKNVPQQYFSVPQKISHLFNKKKISYLFKNKSIYEKFFKNIDKISKSKKNLWNLPNDTRIIDDLDKILKQNLPVFEIVDKKKFRKYVEKDCNYNVFNRVYNLNKILEYTNQ